MGQIHHKPSDGFRPATELDPMHPPEAELVMAWDSMEVEEEFQRRGLGAFAAAAVEARLEGADLFALTDEQMLARGLPPEELASFRWLRARTLRCAAAEEASELLFGTLSASRVTSGLAAVTAGGAEIFELERGHGLQPGDSVRLGTDAEGGRGEAVTVVAPVGPASVGVRPPVRGSSGRVPLYRLPTTLSRAFRGLADPGLARMSAAMGWSPSLTAVDLRNNNLGDASARFLLAAVRANPALTSVRVGGNRGGDDSEGLSEARRADLALACGLNAMARGGGGGAAAAAAGGRVDLRGAGLDDVRAGLLCGAAPPVAVAEVVVASDAKVSAAAVLEGIEAAEEESGLRVQLMGNAAKKDLASPSRKKKKNGQESGSGTAGGGGRHRHHHHRQEEAVGLGALLEEAAPAQDAGGGDFTAGQQYAEAKDWEEQHLQLQARKDAAKEGHHHHHHHHHHHGDGDGEHGDEGLAELLANESAQQAPAKAEGGASDEAALGGDFLSARWLSLAVLGVNSSVTDLNLSANRIADAGLRHIAAAMASNGALRMLALNRNHFTDGGFDALCLALRGNTVLEELSVAGNALSERSDRPLKKLMAHNTSIARLGLGATKVGERARRAVYARAAENAVRRGSAGTLRLRDLSDKGALGVFEALRTCTSVTEVDMKHNAELTNLAGAKLLEVLAHNAAITKLDTVGTPLLDEELCVLLKAKVRRNREAFQSSLARRQSTVVQ